MAFTIVFSDMQVAAKLEGQEGALVEVVLQHAVGSHVRDAVDHHVRDAVNHHVRDGVEHAVGSHVKHAVGSHVRDGLGGLDQLLASLSVHSSSTIRCLALPLVNC